MDLVTGNLEQTNTDVDLGDGLHFTRFYSGGVTSNTNMLVTQVGRNWRHNLLFWIYRSTWLETRVIQVRTPFEVPYVFVKVPDTGSAPFLAGQRTGGSLTEDAAGTVRFTDASGRTLVFDAANLLVAIEQPGKPAISVTRTTDTDTFSNGLASMAVQRYPSGHANAGKVMSVSGNGQTTSFTYDANHQLKTVTKPDLGTPSPTDTIVYTYSYASLSSSGVPARLTKIERTARGATSTLTNWLYSGYKVSQIDEPGVDQKLNLSYTTSSTTVKNLANQTLATYSWNDGQLMSVSGSGGPGADIPFASATYIDNAAVGTSYKTTTDLNGNKTLFESYAREGLAGRIVDGWVDGTAPGGSGKFSADDSYVRLREFTYHPTLAQPLTVTENSSLTGAMDRVAIFDYDDPNAPGDDPNTPNQAPTQLVRKVVRKGKSLDGTGATIAMQTETRFAYNAQADLTSVTGPRTENHTEHLYDAVTGYRTATRRFLNGPGSSYLETTYSNFDALGNPQTVTDANGRVTTFTYDGLGNVITATPPWGGPGSSTVTLTWDVDNRLTRVDFPNDSFGQASFLRMGYTSKGSPTFVADAHGNAVVFEYVAKRRTREARYTGFVDLSNRGTLVGDATFSFDTAGHLFRAFNPLFAGNTVYTEYGYDPKGNPIDVTDENAKHDDLLYDKIDRLLEIEQVRTGGTFETGFQYDPASAVSRITDPAAKQTDYLTDDLGRLVKVVSPDTGTTLYLHDAAGNTTSKIEAFGRKLSMKMRHRTFGITDSGHGSDLRWPEG